jgi:hypothetical protein
VQSVPITTKVAHSQNIGATRTPLRRICKYQRGNQNLQIEEGQTTQLSKETKRQKRQTTAYKTLRRNLPLYLKRVILATLFDVGVTCL